MQLTRHFSKQGFSLIEVAVAMAVLSIGLLGLSNLQMKSLRFNVSAHYDGIAAQQAREMADRMRANIRAVLAGQYDDIRGIPDNPKQCNDIAVICSPAELQAYDVFVWNTANGNLLPGGIGTVRVEPQGSVFLISVSWDDHGQAKNYRLRFQP